ncbi:MAG: hypothetical protein MZV63_25145 [Marinilabiliales bacterium]|nr:hypothetical protein [Marinilabiliales bacterium]
MRLPSSDEELIQHPQKIAGVAASQLENGTITASQYLTELNNEKQAVISAGGKADRHLTC